MTEQTAGIPYDAKIVSRFLGPAKGGGGLRSAACAQGTVTIRDPR